MHYIQRLKEFIELQTDFARNRKPNELARRLFEMGKNFEDEYPEIRLDEHSNTIDERGFAAHGTNALALLLACTLTDGQLLPGNEMKVRGIPRVTGELGYAKKGAIVGRPNTVSQNSVSTIGLHNKDVCLDNAFEYARLATTRHSYSYEHFALKYLRKYEKECTRGIVDKAIGIFCDDNLMQEAYKKLSSTPVVILGSRIGDKGGISIRYGIPNEYLCKRFNISAVILEDEDKEYVQNLLSEMSPIFAKGITYLTTQEVKSFEGKRIEVPRTNSGRCVVILPPEYKNSFVHDFSQAFRNDLTFSFANKPCVRKVQEAGLIRRGIYDDPKEFTDSVTYYIDAQQNYVGIQQTLKDNKVYKLAFVQQNVQQSSTKQNLQPIEFNALNRKQQDMFKSIIVYIDLLDPDVIDTVANLYVIDKVSEEYNSIFYAKDAYGKMLIDYAHQITFTSTKDLIVRHKIINTISDIMDKPQQERLSNDNLVPIREHKNLQHNMQYETKTVGSNDTTPNFLQSKDLKYNNMHTDDIHLSNTDGEKSNTGKIAKVAVVCVLLVLAASIISSGIGTASSVVSVDMIREGCAKGLC